MNWIAIFVTTALLLAGNISARADEVIVTDQAGRSVTIKQPVERVITTFIPATIFALCAGLSDKIVGASTKDESSSIYEALIDKKPPPTLVGNRTVGLNLETIASLKPDLVIMYGQKDGIRTADRLTKLGFPAIVIIPESLEEVEKSLDLIGQASKQQAHTGRVLAAMTNLKQKVHTQVREQNHPPVYYATSSMLKTVSGEMMQNHMIGLAGGTNVSSATKGFFIDISREQLYAWNPEVIICSDRLAPEELKRLASPEFINLAANRTNKIYKVPGETYWDFPSPLAMAGVVWMSSKIHPEVISANEAQKTIENFYDTVFGLGFSKTHPKVVGRL